MPTDVIIEPGSGQIYWNDSAGSPQSISIKGDAQNTISVVGYSGAFSPGSSAGGTFIIASFNDNSGASAFVPGTTNYDLGSSTYRWSVYGYTGNFSSDVVISSSTQSTSVTSGALRVNGGVGISGRMYFNTAAMGTTGIASPPTFAFIGSTGDPIYLQVLEDNSIAFEGSQGQLFSITPNLSTGYIYSVNDITGIPLLRANANANVTANEFGGNFGIGVTNPGYKLHVVGSVGFTSVTASTSPTTGTLVVSGGVGVGGTLNIGGRLNLWNSTNTNFTSFVSTATGNTVYNLPATTPATGSSVLQSDSVGNLSWVGFVANSAATATTAQNINSVVASTSGTHFILFSPVNGGSGIAVSSDSGFTVNPATNVITANTFSGNISATGTTSGFVGVTDTTASTSTTTGALVVTGGVGIGQSAIIGGRVGIGTNSLLNGMLTVNTVSSTNPGIRIDTVASQSRGAIEVTSTTGSGSTVFTLYPQTTSASVKMKLHGGTINHLDGREPAISIGNYNTPGVGVVIRGTNGSDASPLIEVQNNPGSIIFSVGGAGAVYVGSTTVSTSSSTGALRVDGGVGIGQTLFTSPSSASSISGVVLNNGIVTSGTWAGTIITARYGGTGHSTYNKGDILVGVGGTLARFAVGNDLSILSADSSSATGVTWKGLDAPTYGAFGSTATQQVTAANTETLVSYNRTYQANNVSIGSGTTTRVYVNDSGIFNVQFSAQIALASGTQPKNIDMWFKIDGVNIPQSNTRQTIAGKDQETVLALNFVSTFISGQYLELAYSSPDSNMQIGGFTGLVSPTRPDIPSMILTVTPVSSILPGSGLAITGLASLNLLTSNAQTMVTGTSGVDFGISSIGSVHTFNIPDASTTARGLISTGSQTLLGSKTFASGVAITANTASTSTTTGALTVSGGVGIAQTAFIGGNVNILGSTASTYMANGALTVAGGVGISGQLSFNRAAMGYTGIASNPTMAFIGTTGSPITLTVLSDNGLQFEGTSGKLFGINNNLSTGWIFNVGDISGLPLIRANADGTVAMGEFAGNIGIGMSNPAYKLHVIGSVGFTSVTASTNTTSGTLVVSGGVGIGQSLNVGGRLHLWNATNTNFTAFLSASTGNHTYTLPANVPSTGTSVLQADTSGVLSWVGFSANSASVANTAQNLNTVAATTSATHYLLFSPVNGASGVAVSSDTELSYNPSTNILSASVFSGNVSATAVTSTNFFGTLTGNVTGNVTGTSTTSQNVNTVAATTSATHFLTFSPVNGASGVALSSDANLTFNPATNVLTTDIFSGNVSATAVTSTNFFGTLTGNVTGNLTGTATTSQNINLAAGANNSNHSVVFSLNATGSGVALSSDAGLQYNPSTNVLTADVFSGNVSATAVTATNFFGTFQGSSATAVTSQNINTTSAATSASHYILFSPVNATTSGVAVSSDASLQFNPATNVLTVDVFSGNASGTAATFTNFFGTHVGNVTGNVTGTATTSQNVNTVAATTSASHFLTFSPVNGASGVALSSDANLTFNPSTNVLTTDVFSGNVSATAVTSTNFFGTLTGNVTGNLTGTATTAQNVNLAAGANASNHSVVFSLNATGTGIALSSDAGLQYNPSTNVLTADVFSGNVTGTAITATNFYGTHVGNVTGNVTGTATTSQNINTTSATTAGAHYLLFSPVNATASGVAVSSDSTLQFNPGTNVLTTDVFSGNLSATAATATNFFGTLVGNSSTATTAANMNVVAASTNSAHYITFSPASSGSGLATSADADLAYNPSTNVLTAGVFSGNLSATAATATNFFGTLVGNSSTATTATNVNLAAGANASNHSIVFSLNATGSGVALSSDAELQYNPSTNALSVGTGNITANSVRIGNSANTIDTSSGNLTLDSTGGQINLNDNVVVQGNLTVQGTTLTVDSTITTIVDPVIVLGSGVGGTHSTADNNQDRGIEFRYSNGGTAVTGFFGFQDTDYKFRYIPNATLSGTNVYSGTVGVIVANIEGNVSGTAVTATNFYGTLVGNTATATTSQNINTTTAATASAHYILFSPVNATASGVAVSSDSTLQFNPGTNVLTTDVFSGNLSATAATATNFFGTLVGNSSTATTSRNVNTVSANTSANHFILFSPVDGGSGVAVSSDSGFTINPATNVVTAATFAGNLSATAATSTNFFGTLTGNVTGNLTGTATTSQNINTVSATTSASHFLLFSPVNGASGVAVSSDTQLSYNPATDVLSSTTFSGNLSGTAVTSTNFFGTLTGNVTGNVTGTATTATNINLAAGANNSNHSVVFSLNATGTGVGLSSDAGLQYNPSTNVLTADVFSGNFTGTAATATNFFGTHVGPVTGNVTGTATTSQNVNTVSATTSASHFLLFSPVNGASGVAVSSDTQLTYNPATDVLSATTFSGNVSATAVTATNFFGTLVGNTATATTSQNINTTAATTAGAHYLLFSPVNATASGVAVSSDATLQFNPGTNVLTTDVFSGNLSATAATATNFFGTHVGPVTGNVTGNVTGTATTAINTYIALATSGTFYPVLTSVSSTTAGVGLSVDGTDFSYNAATHVLTVANFAGNLSATAATATNFFGTLVGNSSTATTASNLNINVASTNSLHYITFTTATTGSGLASSTDVDFTYNPGSNVLTAGVFSGNLSGTAVTATNFFGTLTGNVTGTATTAQNVNVVAATTAATHFVTFSPASSGSGLATSADTQLTYNPATDVLSATTFSGNVTGTAITATNFYGTLVGSVGTATTSQNINTTAATTAGVHYLLFSPVNATASGVAVSSDATLQFNPGTNVLTTDVFSGNLSATAATATNFFGTLTGNVTGNLTGTATTAQNVNVVAATTAATHFVTFSPASSGSGLATSADTQLTYNPATDVLSSTTFSGNLSGTAVTATNFFGALTGNVTGTSTTSQNINTTAATTAGVHYLLFSPVNATASGVAVSSDSTLQFNPGTNVLTTDVFSGNLSATAATATNFFGSLTGNVTGTATTAQNVNLAAGANNSNHSVVFSLNATGTGVGLSSDAGLQYNPSTNVLTADVFSGNFTGTAATATNFFGTHVGAVTGNVTGTATTSQNVNTVSATTSANHFLTFSPVNGASGVALSSDAQLTYNPATDVLSATTFSGNVTGTAITATNFYGTLVGSVGTATTSQNINTTAATTAGVHYLLFSPVNATASGVAVSSDATLQFNPGTNVLTTDIFSGNLSATAATATNFFGTLTGNVTGTATTAQNINLAAGANNTNHSVIFSLNATGTGVGLSSDAGLQYNPSTNVLTADVFSGNFTGTAATATNFFGTHVGAVTGNVTGTATTSQNVNTVSATTSASHFLTFSPVNGASGVALSSDAQLTYNPATDVLSTTTFSGNVTGTAITATNFFGTLTGNVTGNLTGTATTSQNLNTVSATTAGNHFLLFSPVNGASGVAVSSDATLQFNPATNVLTTDVFSGNVSGTAVTATNFFGSLTGNVTGTATTAQNINLAAGANNSNHSVVFSLNATGTGVGLSSDAGLQYNPSTNVLTSDIFSGNFTGTAVTATNFFGTLTGNVTGNLTGTATTAQNLNVALATTAATHFVTFSPASSGSGLATSADTQLTYNPATDVLSATTFSGNVTGTAITATNFYGTLVGSVGTATTSANVNTVAATTAGVHYLTFSPVNGASGVALSSDASLQFNPSTNVLTTDIFAGNLSATAATSGFVRVSDLTNTTSSTTGALVVSGGVGIGGSINVDGTVKLNYVSGTALNIGDRFTFGTTNNSENFNINSNFSFAFNVQDKANNNRFTIDVSNNKTYLSGNSASHELRLYNANQSTYTGFAASNSGTVTYILPAGDGSSGQVLATNGSARLYWSTPSAGSGGGSSGVNPGAQYQVAFYSATGSSVDGSTTFTNNTATSTVSITHATSSTATNVGALVVTGGLGLGGNAFIGGTVTVTNSTASNSTATGAVVITGGLGVGGQINAASVVTSGNAVISGNLTFNGNGTFGNLATADTIAFNARSTTDFNPSVTNTSDLGLNTLVWRNLFANFITGSAVTATNFYGTLAGNVTGTATTSQNINTVAATTSASHFLLFSPVNGATGVAVSSDTQLTYNPATDVLSATTFSGNVSGTAVTATNFFGTLTGNVTGNVTGTATTSQNINTTAATTAGAHYLLFSPVNATASGVAVSSDATLQFNPGTNVLTTDVFSGNLSATAATATNFFGTLTGNVTGTATTAQNVNTVSANTNATHFLTFSPVNGGSGVALSTDTNLTFNSLSNVMTSGVFSGNLSATAATSGLFAVGNLTYAAANLLAAFQSSVNGYNQVIIQNSNNGANASSDLVVNNDISTDTGAFGTFGMNSSGFTGLGSTNIPNAVYVTAATAELVLGTTTNNRIRFVNENIDTFQITGTGSSVYTTTATLSRNSGAFVVAGGAAIGLSLSVGQGIQLYNSTNGNHTGFKAGATASNSVYTLPLAYPSTGSSILQSDTSGTMIWVNAPTGGSATPAGNNTELQYNNSGAFGGATGLTWQAVNNTLQINSNASHTTSTQVGLRLENGLASGGQATRWSPTFEMVGRSGIANVYYSRFAAEVVPSGPATYASALRFKYSQDQGTASYSSNIFSIHSTLGIGIGGSTVSSNFMSYIRAHESQAADIFYKLPLAAPGTGASFLQCDTSGNMSWVNSPGGGSGSPAGSPKQIQFNNNGAFGGAGGFEYITVGGSAVTVSMFSVAGGGYTSGLWVNVLSASSTKIGIGLSNPQYELEINGELSATNKSFVIDHPTKAGMKLRYGSLEGPENGVYVRGELKGSNIIEVPDHWIGLVHEDSYTVHLTPIGRYSQLYVEKIENYNVYVSDNCMNPIHCYYSVWAERKDIPKLVTEY